MSTDVKLVKTLLDISLFEDLDYTQVQAIIDVGTRETVEPGKVLSEPRTIDERLLILLDGRLRLESAAGDCSIISCPFGFWARWAFLPDRFGRRGALSRTLRTF